MTGFSSALLLLMLLGSLLAVGIRDWREPFRLPRSWQGDAARLEAAYEAQGGAQELIALLKALAFEAQSEDGAACREKTARFGGLLLDMARRGEVDLERADDQGEMRLLLRAIRAAGAR